MVTLFVPIGQRFSTNFVFKDEHIKMSVTHMHPRVDQMCPKRHVGIGANKYIFKKKTK